MARSILEELKGLGPVEGLLAVQHTAQGASTPSVSPTADQSLQGYKGATTPNDQESRVDISKVTNELEQEPSPSGSDSEDEHDAAPRTLNILERHKAQNSKFSAW